MPKFLADEDFNNNILAVLRQRQPGLDIVRTQDVGLLQQPDPDILAHRRAT